MQLFTPINTHMYNFIKDVILNEVRSDADQNRLTQLQLPYARGDLDPVISEDTIKYHYGKLYKTYVERFNNGEGDPDFNEAGAFLHRIYFEQFQSPSTSNNPEGLSEELILKHYEDFDKFKAEVEKAAMAIQGSGWVYLSRTGQIKTIKNHQIRSDIILLIDWWEHAWALDYQADKAKYLNNIWRIINWTVINARLSVSKT
jgi:Fe-Mn family superoxide dismutase